VLLVAVIAHVATAVSLARENRAARPKGYQRFQAKDSTYASRTMMWSGPIIALFVVYHLMHLTFGNAHPSFREGDVYHNFVAGFQVVPASAVYIVAVLALGLHLYHGSWSMLQSLGLSHSRYDSLRRRIALGVTAAVVLGNLSFPIAVLTGLLHE
jgi:succinate dehydrogenase / fumarate reductase cytochrome b subunit